MTDHHELDEALDRLFAAARAHLAAVKAADGRIDDDEVWQRYVELNNLAVAYDELLMETFGEVTPWDLERIDPEEADTTYGVGLGGVDGSEGADEAPVTVSVRQRRDYLVPSVSALLRIAEAARRTLPAGVTPSSEEPPTNATAAVAALLEAGDGGMGSLDIPELEPLSGATVICQVTTPMDSDPQLAQAEDVASWFAVSESDEVRLIVERPFSSTDSADSTGSTASSGPSE